MNALHSLRGGWSRALLLSVGFVAGAIPCQDWTMPGGVYPGTGAAMALGDIDLDGRSDVVLVHTENVDRPFPNHTLNGQRIRISFGSAINEFGQPTGALGFHRLDVAFPFTAPTGEVPGAGAALVQLDGDPRLDLVVGVVYSKGPNDCTFEWRVASNLQADGAPSAWSAVRSVALPTDGHQGAGITFGALDNDPRPDAILMVCADRGPSATYRYRAMRNWVGDGPLDEGPWIQIPAQGHLAEGGDVALVQLDGNPRPELVCMAYDAPAGDNGFRWKIGWNVNPNGATLRWADRREELLSGHALGEGAGFALAQLDADPRWDVLFTALEHAAPFPDRVFEVRGARNALGVVSDLGGGCLLNGVLPVLEPEACQIPTDCEAFRMTARNVVNFPPPGMIAGLVYELTLTTPGLSLAPLFPECELQVLPVNDPLPFPLGIEPSIELPPGCGIDIVYAQAYFLDPTTLDLGLSTPVCIRYGRL